MDRPPGDDLPDWYWTRKVIVAFQAFTDETVEIPEQVWREAEKLHVELRRVLLTHPDVDHVAGLAAVEAHAQTAEAGGIVRPPDVDACELPPRVRQDLTLSALIVLVVCFTWISLATVPFPQSLLAPLLEAIVYLHSRHNQLNKPQ